MVKKQNCVIVYIKTDDVYKDIAEDVETRFDTSNYELDRSLPKGKNKKVIGFRKDELGGKIMTDDSSEDKKGKDAIMSVMRRKLKVENYKNCLEATKIKNKINCLEKNKIDIVFKKS